MMARDYFAQARAIHMRIDLRSGNISVAQQFLHDAQIGSPTEQVRCKAVTQHMRIDLVQTSVLGAAANDLPDRNTFKRPAPL